MTVHLRDEHGSVPGQFNVMSEFQRFLPDLGRLNFVPEKILSGRTGLFRMQNRQHITLVTMI